MFAKSPAPDPKNPDAIAAHLFLTEILTRVSTQRLHFNEGDETAALDSLYELFGVARATIKANVGCAAFSAKTVAFLNADFRSFMARWHRKRLAGELDTRDGAVAFRKALEDVQDSFRDFAKELHQMAYGTPLPDFPPDRSADAFAAAPLAFGIPSKGSITAQDGAVRAAEVLDQINADERAAILQRRAQFVPQGSATASDADPLEDVAALALSGGGIRSASFSLGVAQVLCKQAQIINSVDIMSTVSGGGFTGAFLARRMAQGGAQAVANPDDDSDTEAVRYLRQRANYLTVESTLLTLGLIMNLLAGMVLNWMAPAALIAALVTSVHLLELSGVSIATLGVGAGVCLVVAVLSHFAVPVSWGRIRDFGIWTFSIAAAGLVAMLLWDMSGDSHDRLVLLGIVSLGVGFFVYAWCPYKYARTRVAAMWVLMLVAAYLLGLYLVHVGYGLFVGLVENKTGGLLTGASIATIAAALPALSRMLPMLGSAWVRVIGNQVVLTLASFAVPALALMFGYALYYYGQPAGAALGQGVLRDLHLTVLLIVTVFLVVTALAVININATGPRWVYRRQLANTFVKMTQDGPEEVPLSQLDPEQKAPYLLLNAVVNLPNSKRIEMRERRGDFFVFSKRWCGSPVTGYRPTTHWLHWYRRELDLATAVATSGAAVAPHMALLSLSRARALLSFLNIRLGFWVRRPALSATAAKGSGGRPGAWMLLREMFSFGMDERSNWMMLTDGAHLENSAIYELLRRRCKFIVAVDASAEKTGGFSTILTLVRHAGVDFGVRIHTDLGPLRPDPETGLSRAHGVLCEIDYPAVDGQPAGKGLLLIIKLSLTGNESELINAYRLENPSFPNVSTADQFFDEHQFEAFRQLGSHAAHSLLEPALVGDGPVRDVEDWLTRLYERIPPRRDS